MSRDNINILIRLTLVLSFASSLVALHVGLLTEDRDREDDNEDLECERKLRVELDDLHQEIDQLKLQLSKNTN
jgi:hypothetical protein